MQRNQEMRYSIPEFTAAAHAPLPPPPLPPQAHYQAVPAFHMPHQTPFSNGRAGYRDASFNEHRSDALVADMSLSRSIDQPPTREMPRANHHPRPNTAESMSTLLDRKS